MSKLCGVGLPERPAGQRWKLKETMGGNPRLYLQRKVWWGWKEMGSYGVFPVNYNNDISRAINGSARMIIADLSDLESMKSYFGTCP